MEDFTYRSAPLLSQSGDVSRGSFVDHLTRSFHSCSTGGQLSCPEFLSLPEASRILPNMTLCFSSATVWIWTVSYRPFHAFNGWPPASGFILEGSRNIEKQDLAERSRSLRVYYLYLLSVLPMLSSTSQCIHDMTSLFHTLLPSRTKLVCHSLLTLFLPPQGKGA